MIARRLPLDPDTFGSHRTMPAAAPIQAAPAGWARKTFALALHMTCLGLFGLFVVWPVASPASSGELAREFKPVLQVLASWVR